MENNIKVLWFDDEHEKFSQQKEDAKLDFGIKLHSYTNAEEGIKELKNNSVMYDALILDGKFYKSSNQQEGNVLDNSAITKVLRSLGESKLSIPCFVFSGQTHFLNELNVIENYGDLLAIEKVYDKNALGDFEKLCNDIVETVGNIESYKIKKEHPEAYALCEKISTKRDNSIVIEDFFKVIKALENKEVNNDDIKRIRDILEALVDHLEYSGIIAIDVKFSAISYFLKGTHNEFDFKDSKPIIESSMISHLFEVFETVIQDANHNKKKLELKVNEFVNKSDNKPYYLYRSLVYALLQILTYFNKFTDDNQDIEKNKSRWKKKGDNNKQNEESRVGVVIGNCLFRCNETREEIEFNEKKMGGLNIGDKVKVKAIPHKDNKGKLFITYIGKI